MRLLLEFETEVGPFYIGQSTDGRFHPVFEGESLGSYANLRQATEDLAQNVTFSVLHPIEGTLLDTSTLGIPEDPDDWIRRAGAGLQSFSPSITLDPDV